MSHTNADHPHIDYFRDSKFIGARYEVNAKMGVSEGLGVCCRAIEERDIRSVIDCLKRGFPHRREAYWTTALARLASRPRIGELPRFGYLLEHSNRVVGVILVIFSRRERADGHIIRCNLSSWCVDKEFRG